MTDEASTTTIFLSYDHRDQTRARRFREALIEKGFEVWYDERIIRGENWEKQVLEKLHSCDVVLVLWSRNSTAKDDKKWVRYEASVGLERGRLAQVVIDEFVQIPNDPVAFSAHQAALLTNWGEMFSYRNHPVFLDVVDEIQKRAKGETPNEPRPPSPIRWYKRGIIYALPAVFIVLFGLNGFGAQNAVCRINGVSDFCGSMGLGGRPSRAERLDWEKIPKGEQNCAPIKSFIEKYKNNPHSQVLQIANNIYDLRETKTSQEYESIESAIQRNMPAPLVRIKNGNVAAGTNGAAQAAKNDAQKFCEGIGEDGRENIGLNQFEVTKTECDAYTCAATYEFSCHQRFHPQIEMCVK